MAIERSNYRIDVVTSSPARTDAFRTLLGADHVRQILPRFTESVIRKPVNSSPAEWPVEMAEAKAFQDIAALMVLAATNASTTEGLVGEIQKDGTHTIRIYSDTVQVIFAGDTTDETRMVLEKPKDITSWLLDTEHGAMVQSGKHFEICTGITGIDISNPDAHPATILVRIAGKMRPYTIHDIQTLLDTHGEKDVLPHAGGISLQSGGTALYDKHEPLRCFIQTDPNAQPTLLFELKEWSHLDMATLRRFVYGAIPEVLDTLLLQLSTSKITKPESKKTGYLFPFPTNTNGDIPKKS